MNSNNGKLDKNIGTDFLHKNVFFVLFLCLFIVFQVQRNFTYQEKKKRRKKKKKEEERMKKQQQQNCLRLWLTVF